MYSSLYLSTDVDYRRHFRPFFLDPDLVTPTKYKKYYDFVCWVVIQSTYNYVVQPFIILTVWDSLRLWGRVKVSRIFRTQC
jgi:lysophospholipid acyltransferase